MWGDRLEFCRTGKARAVLGFALEKKIMASMVPEIPEPNRPEQDDVEAMIAEETGARVRKNSNVFIAINTGGLILVAVWVGIFIQQMSEVRAKIASLESVAVLSNKIDYLTAEVNRLRDELDRLSRRYAADNAR